MGKRIRRHSAFLIRFIALLALVHLVAAANPDRPTDNVEVAERPKLLVFGEPGGALTTPFETIELPTC
jgi:hypothetical protein